MKTAFKIALGAAAATGAARLMRSEQRRTEARHAANKLKGAAHAVTPQRHEQMDDATLADRVRSQIFRPADAPKASVSVDVQAGVAYLRGEVADEAWISRLADDARKVEGITGVKNLLHSPGTPTPTAEPRSVAAERFESQN